MLAPGAAIRVVPLVVLVVSASIWALVNVQVPSCDPLTMLPVGSTVKFAKVSEVNACWLWLAFKLPVVSTEFDT